VYIVCISWNNKEVVLMVSVISSRQMSWLSYGTEHDMCSTYSHSLTHDHLTHDQPKLQLKFP